MRIQLSEWRKEGGQCGTIIDGQGSEGIPGESRVALPPGKLVLFDDFGSRVRVQSGVVYLDSSHGSPAG